MADKTTRKQKRAPDGVAYVCISPHDEPIGPGGHIKRLVGDEDTFTKNPGPYWRPAKEIKKTEEVTDNAA